MCEPDITSGDWVVEAGTYTVSAPHPTRQHAMRIPIAYLPPCVRHREGNASAIAAVPTMLSALRQIQRLAQEASADPADAPRLRAALAEIAQAALAKASTPLNHYLERIAA